jgi:hypothetical protein
MMRMINLVVILMTGFMIYQGNMFADEVEKPEVKPKPLEEVKKEQKDEEKEEEAEKKETVAFLGVSTSPVHAALAKQLKLTSGLGLVIEHIEWESAAEKAGFEKYDILTKFEDQLLINFHQMSVLIKMKKPEDKVKVTYIRDGKEKETEVTLGSRELTAHEKNEGGLPDPRMFRNMMPRVMDADKLKRMLKEHGIEMNEEMLEELKERNKRRWHGHGNKEGIMMFPHMKGTRTVMKMGDDTIIRDGEHTMTITMKDGKKHLKAEDKDGNIIFDGDIDTEEKWKKVPKEIADKIIGNKKFLQDPQGKEKKEEKNKEKDEIF